MHHAAAGVGDKEGEEGQQEGKVNTLAANFWHAGTR